MTTGKLELTEEEWRSRLSPEEYSILREKGTERAFTGKYYNEHSDGIYCCAGCGEPLFDAHVKFESGTGWPSFYAAEEGAVATNVDDSHGMIRTEATCAACGGHLGHKFNDGPAPTGVRFCVNSGSLRLKPRE